MTQTITDEEIDIVRQNVKKAYKLGGSYLNLVIQETAKLILSKKDAECEKRLNDYNDKIISDLKQMGFSSLDDVEHKIKEKDVEIKELEEQLQELS